MEIFKEISTRGHEQVCYFNDTEVGLKAIVAIHSTILGPSLGGCRMWNYKTEQEALIDVLRLSRGMTYKAAIAGLGLGGGKSVIIGDPKTDKSEYLFRSFGKFVNGLSGRYITAEDVGTTVSDMEYVKKETDYVTGISHSMGGSGDPSLLTSYGVYLGIKSAVKFKLKRDSLESIKIAVQGLGNVGMDLCKYLVDDGAKIYVYDIDESKVERAVSELSAISVSQEEIYSQDVDIFSPCALGGVINDTTIPLLKCSIIAGAANNVLEDERKHSFDLMNKDILYAPDYAINSGGVINCYSELEGYNKDNAFTQAEEIYNTLLNIFNLALTENIPTNLASDRIAENKIQAIKKQKSINMSENLVI